MQHLTSKQVPTPYRSQNLQRVFTLPLLGEAFLRVTTGPIRWDFRTLFLGKFYFFLWLLSLLLAMSPVSFPVPPPFLLTSQRTCSWILATVGEGHLECR